MTDAAWIVVGSGRSLREMSDVATRLPAAQTIACNRAIEVVPAGNWVWVDRIHYERSAWHPHAKAAKVAYASGFGVKLPGNDSFEISRTLPCAPIQLYLRGGTLTFATHFALRQGAKTIVFVACDAWDLDADRYHPWDGAPLSADGIRIHQNHLVETAEGIRSLAAAYPEVTFLDATAGPQHLGWPKVDLREFLVKEVPVTLPQSPVLPPDIHVPHGYGKFVTVTPLLDREALLWFEDAGGNIRAIRVAVDVSDSLSLEIRGQTAVMRS